MLAYQTVSECVTTLLDSQKQENDIHHLQRLGPNILKLRMTFTCKWHMQFLIFLI